MTSLPTLTLTSRCVALSRPGRARAHDFNSVYARGSGRSGDTTAAPGGLRPRASFRILCQVHDACSDLFGAYLAPAPTQLAGFRNLPRGRVLQGCTSRSAQQLFPAGVKILGDTTACCSQDEDPVPPDPERACTQVTVPPWSEFSVRRAGSLWLVALAFLAVCDVLICGVLCRFQEVDEEGNSVAATPAALPAVSWRRIRLPDIPSSAASFARGRFTFEAHMPDFHPHHRAKYPGCDSRRESPCGAHCCRRRWGVLWRRADEGPSALWAGWNARCLHQALWRGGTISTAEILFYFPGNSWAGLAAKSIFSLVSWSFIAHPLDVVKHRAMAGCAPPCALPRVGEC
jgi:hypothetical protein